MIYEYNAWELYVSIAFYVVLIVISIAAAIAWIVSICKGAKTYDGIVLYFKSFPWHLKIIYGIIPMLIFLISISFLTFNVFQTSKFVYSMENGDALIIEGEMQIEAVEDNNYRDTYLGKDITFSIDGKTIKPFNSFSDEVLEELKSTKSVRIVYGYLNGDAFIWSIERSKQQ